MLGSNGRGRERLNASHVSALATRWMTMMVSSEGNQGWSGEEDEFRL